MEFQGVPGEAGETRESGGRCRLQEVLKSREDVFGVPGQSILAPQFSIGSQGLHQALDGGQVEDSFLGRGSPFPFHRLGVCPPGVQTFLGSVFHIGVIEQGSEVIGGGSPSHPLEIDPDAASRFPLHLDIGALEIAMEESLGFLEECVAHHIGFRRRLFVPESRGLEHHLEEVFSKVVPFPQIGFLGKGGLEWQGGGGGMGGALYMEAGGLGGNFWEPWEAL